MTSEIFYATLVSATLLCALVAGLVFGCASVVMPGIAKLSDREFLSAFKYIDGIIQNNQPAFMLVWVGSIFAIIASTILGTLNLSGGPLYLLWCASALYLLAVQLPTIRFNIPLNNTVQALDIEVLSASELAESRANFEAPWNRWNKFRTFTSTLSVLALLMVLLQL